MPPNLPAAIWRRLTPECQATLVLELLVSPMESEHDGWLRETLAARWPVEDNPFERAFSVHSVSRADLQWLGFDERDIQQLRDYDMRRIAQLAGSDSDGFWDGIVFAARKVLDKKGGR